ncbi:MAG: response regulator [Bacteriovoracaceae bacterium]|nr:response regulator [Bacteroidota bacterium]
MKIDDVSVLVVDDSDHIRTLFAMTFKKMGINKVHFAADGVEGLAKFQSAKPTITFLDNMLPRMSGMEVLKEIRGMKSDAIVVIVSAVSNLEVVQEAKVKGASFYLVKPYVPSKITEIMQKLLNLERSTI